MIAQHEQLILGWTFVVLHSQSRQVNRSYEFGQLLSREAVFFVVYHIVLSTGSSWSRKAPASLNCRAESVEQVHHRLICRLGVRAVPKRPFVALVVHSPSLDCRPARKTKIKTYRSKPVAASTLLMAACAAAECLPMRTLLSRLSRRNRCAHGRRCRSSYERRICRPYG